MSTLATPGRRRGSPGAARRRGRPPGSTSDATRTRILRAARGCFARRGYASTTNHDIAGQAGITAAALYQYFDSKRALYMATVHDAQAELLPRFRSAVRSAASARDALRDLVLASVHLHESDASLAPFLSALPVEMQRHAEIAEAMATEPSEIVTLVMEAVSRGVQSGEIAETMAPGAVSMFLACTMGLSLYAATTSGGALGPAVGAYASLIDGVLFGAG